MKKILKNIAIVLIALCLVSCDGTVFNKFFDIPVEKITLNNTTLALTVDGTSTLTATITPSDATDTTYTWSSDDETVATVDANGLVTAKKIGTAKITATANDGSGKKASCTVSVIIPVTGLNLTTSTNLAKNATATLVPVIYPTNATITTVTWSSSNANIVSVDANGVITGLADGTAVITVTTDNGGFTASCTVTVGKKTPNVTAPTVPTTEITLSATEKTAGTTKKLLATLGSTDVGTLKYAVTYHAYDSTDTTLTTAPADAAYTFTAIPEKASAGYYKVWYKVFDEGEALTTAASLDVTIYNLVTTTTQQTCTGGPYLVNQDASLSAGLVVSSEKNVFTIKENTTLTINGSSASCGISISQGSSLTIKGNGTCQVFGGDGNNTTKGGNGLTISGSLTINGVHLETTGGKGFNGTDVSSPANNGGNGIEGDFTLESGTVISKGGQGGNGKNGNSSKGKGEQGFAGATGGNGVDGNVTINKGTLNCTGGKGGNGGDGGSGQAIGQIPAIDGAGGKGGNGGIGFNGTYTNNGGTLTYTGGAGGEGGSGSSKGTDGEIGDDYNDPNQLPSVGPQLD